MRLRPSVLCKQCLRPCAQNGRKASNPSFKRDALDVRLLTFILKRHMANYITTEVLSEAYTHLNIEIFEDKEKLEELRKELTKFFQERASFLFGADVEIKVIFEEGSLRTRIIAIGSAAFMLGSVIGAYGSFRESVVQLSNDAVSLAQSANLEVIFRTKTPYCDRLRIEKRKGVFGRVAALLTELDSINSNIEMSRMPTSIGKLKEVNATIDSLLAWDESVDRFFAKFDSPDTEACVADGLLGEVKMLPTEFKWHNDLTQQNFRTQVASVDPNFAGQVAGANARYIASLKAIQKKLNDRITQNIATN